MHDPALGRSKAERAFGKDAPKKSTPNKGVNTAKAPSSKAKDKRSRVNEFRAIHIGMFDGPRPTYGRYNVSEQASDVLNRSFRNRGER
jgi:hypothetical protein